MKSSRYYFPLFLLAAFFAACRTYAPDSAFSPTLSPPPPDYALLANWAAHPDKSDPADRVPTPDLKTAPKDAPVDIFFLHPTTYLGANRHERQWNAGVENESINRKTDETSILYQASIFNGAGRVFAPRYRQAHLRSFYAKKDEQRSAQQSLDLAYADVVAAFDYYLKHWNQGRPFIIAGHSQGARHAMYLLRDRIQGTPLQKQLVAAYIVGWPVKKDFLKSIPPCRSPEQTGCFCSWRTWEREFGLKKFTADSSIVCTNPLTWTTTQDAYAPKTANHGGVLRKFNQVMPNLADAQVHHGYLLCTKPKFRGSILFRRKNYHIGDLNLYYLNVRENAQLRAAKW